MAMAQHAQQAENRPVVPIAEWDPDPPLVEHSLRADGETSDGDLIVARRTYRRDAATGIAVRHTALYTPEEALVLFPALVNGAIDLLGENVETVELAEEVVA